MKRIGAVFLAACLALCLFSVSASAAGSTYYLSELGMHIDLPEDYIVFTRDTPADDPNFILYGISKEDMDSLLVQQNMYLDAITSTGGTEVVVTMIDSPLEDFNQLSDSTLKILASTFTLEYESLGITLLRSEVYQHSQAKFLKLYISQSSEQGTVYGLQYYTVYDGKAINVTLHSYLGEIGAYEEGALLDIVDTVRFDTAPQLNDPPAETEAFVYTDANTGLSFTVPANWVEKPLNEEREYITAKFVSNLEPGLCILFSGEDFLSQLSEEERGLYSRAEADNSLFTKADIAYIYGCEESEVSTVYFGDRAYFSAETTDTGTLYGLTATATSIVLFRCENGYVYTFRFFGRQESTYYKDFEFLMNSVTYPPADTSATTYPKVLPSSTFPIEPEVTSAPSSETLYRRFTPTNLLFSLVVTVAVYSLPIIIYRYGIRKAPVDRKKGKRITILYGIASFIVMSFITLAVNGSIATGGAIILWSGVNYEMLTRGKKSGQPASVQGTIPGPGASPASADTSDTADTPVPAPFYTPVDAPSSVDTLEPTDTPAPADTPAPTDTLAPTDTSAPVPAVFCHRCGSRLVPGSLFCSQCGTKIPDMGERCEE